MQISFFKKSSDFLIASSEGLSKIATFFIIPVSGLFLATSDFNLWSIIFPSIQILSAGLSFGLPNYVLRSYYVERTGEDVDNSPVYTTFLILTALSTMVFLAFKGLYPGNPFLRWDIYLILITNSFLVIMQQKYQAEKNGVKYFLQSLVWRIGFAMILFGLFVFKIHISLQFLLTSLLIIQFLLFIVGGYQECLPFKLKINVAEQMSILKFGFPLFLMGMMQFVIYMNSRYFVYHRGEESQTAVFSLIHTFAGTLNLLFVIFVRIYIPKLFEALSNKRSQESLFFYKSFMFSLLEIVSLGIFIGLFIYSALYKSGFQTDIFRLAPILILGQFFYGLQLFIVDSLTFYNKTLKLFIISLSSAIFSVVIGFILVSKFGILGGALGVALSQLLSLIIVIYFTFDLFKSILGFTFCFKRIIRISIMMLSSFAVYTLLGQSFVIAYFLLLIGYLTWKMDIPLVLKKFV